MANSNLSNVKLVRHIKKFQSQLLEAKNEFLDNWQKEITKGIPIENMEFLNMIGYGAFGKVVLARNKSNRNTLAIKILEKRYIIKTSHLRHFKYEIKSLNSIKFVFITRMIYFYIDNVYVYIGMPFVSGGEMFELLKKAKKFTEEQSKFYTAQVLLALQYLHYVGLIYRDLKPENIMMDNDGYIKLIDFGFCKKLSNHRTYTLCGTPEYLAPEIFLSKGYGFSVDWWAFGILTYEFLAGYPPFKGTEMKLFERISTGKYTCPRHFTNEMKNFLSCLIVVNPLERLGSLKDGPDDIKKHEWYKGLDWDAILQKSLKAPMQPRPNSAGNLSNFKTTHVGTLRHATNNEFSGEFRSFNMV